MFDAVVDDDLIDDLVAQRMAINSYSHDPDADIWVDGRSRSVATTTFDSIDLAATLTTAFSADSMHGFLLRRLPLVKALLLRTLKVSGSKPQAMDSSHCFTHAGRSIRASLPISSAGDHRAQVSITPTGQRMVLTRRRPYFQTGVHIGCLSDLSASGLMVPDSRHGINRAALYRWFGRVNRCAAIGSATADTGRQNRACHRRVIGVTRHDDRQWV